MIFLTVGTQFPFDRLVRALDDIFGQGLIDEEIFAQIGQSSYKPRNFEFVPSLDRELFDDHIRKASSVIGHAGMGTITMALEHDVPLLVMPRSRKYGEVVNDHQVAIAKKFEELGHVLVAYTENEIPEKIKQLKSFVPQPRRNQTGAVVDRIATFLKLLSKKQK